VRLLSAICKRLDYGELYTAYSREKRNEYPPRILLKIMSYAKMRMIHSIRGIEDACNENVKFMYLRTTSHRITTR